MDFGLCTKIQKFDMEHSPDDEKKKRIPKAWLALIVVILICVVGLRLWRYHWPTALIEVKGYEISVLVAKTPWHWYRGLGQRDALEHADAMLFVFPTSARHGIVMRDMRFPIDIVWVEKGVVVDIAPNVPLEPGVLERDLTIYLPRTAATGVLEFPAGWAQAYELKVGDPVRVLENGGT